MENSTHKLEIFRGLVKFKSNTSKIWAVLFFLSVVTIVEVALGIIKPEVLIVNSFLSMKLINWIFIILTIVKAYYIMWDFMHMRDEVRGLQFSVIVTLSFLIAYLAFILLVEGNYIFDVMYEGFVSWNFYGGEAAWPGKVVATRCG
jgi:cytochrome c oxidase subunit 4